MARRRAADQQLLTKTQNAVTTGLQPLQQSVLQGNQLDSIQEESPSEEMSLPYQSDYSSVQSPRPEAVVLLNGDRPSFTLPAPVAVASNIPLNEVVNDALKRLQDFESEEVEQRNREEPLEEYDRIMRAYLALQEHPDDKSLQSQIVEESDK